jgi:hypothetical protein
MADTKPANQMCEGRQYSEGVGGMGDNYVTTTRDQYNNEIPEDRDFHHAPATPGHSNTLYSGNIYNTDVKPGKSVTDLGQSPSKEVTTNNPHQAERGEES